MNSPEDVLKREPSDACRFYGDQVLVVGGITVFVPALDGRNGVECESDGRYDDEEHADDGYQL